MFSHGKWKGVETMKKSMLVLIVGGLLVAVPALAGPLAKEQVSGRANWVVHADVERFRTTQIWEHIRPELDNLGIQEKLLNFETIFTFHPIDDVRNVTIYGKGQDRKNAVALIEGTFDKQKLLAIVGMNPEHEEIGYADRVVHKWVDENKKGPDGLGEITYGCFFQDDLIMIGAGLDAIKHAIDVLKGSARNAANVDFVQPPAGTKGAFLQIMAYDLAQIVGDKPDTAALKQAEQLGLLVGEMEGRPYAGLILKAKSEEAAQAINKMLDGIVAFVTLSGEDNPKLAKLANNVKLSCEHSTVLVRLEADPSTVVQCLKEQWLKKMQKEAQEK
jgi:hypothetical protein